VGYSQSLPVFTIDFGLEHTSHTSLDARNIITRSVDVSLMVTSLADCLEKSESSLVNIYNVLSAHDASLSVSNQETASAIHGGNLNHDSLQTS